MIVQLVPNLNSRTVSITKYQSQIQKADPIFLEADILKENYNFGDAEIFVFCFFLIQIRSRYLTTHNITSHHRVKIL